MSKRPVTVVFILLGVIVVGVLVYANLVKKNQPLSDQEIKNKYCHVTADVRKTDVYCQNPDVYRQHARDNKIIKE